MHHSIVQEIGLFDDIRTLHWHADAKHGVKQFFSYALRKYFNYHPERKFWETFLVCVVDKQLKWNEK